jgi:hypothetical protein
MDANTTMAWNRADAARSMGRYPVSWLDMEPERHRCVTQRRGKMHEMMNGDMGWGMGIFGILLLILVILGVVSLLKYLFRD